MPPRINWDTYHTAYQQLVQRGVDHDAASDKALYLASRGLPTAPANWSLLAYQIRVSLWRRSENRLCVSLHSDALHDSGTHALEDLLAAPATTDPERVALARDELAHVPGDIINLFVNRRRPLTSTEATHLHRFRRRLTG
jgi:hypothetical protein